MTMLPDDPPRRIVAGGGHFDASISLERHRNATVAFARTWRRVAIDIETICSAGPGAVPAWMHGVFRRLDRDLRYLDGLSWTLFDRHERRTVTRLRHAVRLLARTSLKQPTRLTAPVCAACRDRLAQADVALGISTWALCDPESAPIVEIQSMSRPAIGASPGPIDPRLHAAYWAAAAGETSFAWYRVHVAFKSRRPRNAVRLFGAWLALLSPLRSRGTAPDDILDT